jgi:hypothetical protein
MLRNSFADCTVVLLVGHELPADSELRGRCKVNVKPRVVVEPGTVGAPVQMFATGPGCNLTTTLSDPKCRPTVIGLKSAEP